MNLNMTKLPSITLMFGVLIWISPFAVEAQGAVDTDKPRDTASTSMVDKAIIKLEEASFNFGVSYLQMTYKSSNPNSSTKAQITDNGAPNAIMEINSEEKSLTHWPLRGGNAVIGWNINASASSFDTRYQLVDSAFQGKDIGLLSDAGCENVDHADLTLLSFLHTGRVAHGKYVHDAPRSVWSDSLRRTAPRYEALPHSLGRRELDGRVRRP